MVVVHMTTGAFRCGSSMRDTLYRSMLNIHATSAPPNQITLINFEVGSPETMAVHGHDCCYKVRVDATAASLKLLSETLRYGFLEWLPHQRNGKNDYTINQLIAKIKAVPEDRGLGQYNILYTIKLSNLENGILSDVNICKVILRVAQHRTDEIKTET
ncbi:hypothetical protein SCP_1400420 [Sparassis crispa]|uniref:Uncharacterized protein n=1 Tax=Sparassis crispa TaxID=139825 RepID=A0A401H2H9_9APHY|nr:hypothetical protein SCP_1400420 [Sparassis crispa]GBE88637.1 hypothetical protein SCP_1400420 [Sparassis crispa]